VKPGNALGAKYVVEGLADVSLEADLDGKYAMEYQDQQTASDVYLDCSWRM